MPYARYPRKCSGADGDVHRRPLTINPYAATRVRTLVVDAILSTPVRRRARRSRPADACTSWTHMGRRGRPWVRRRRSRARDDRPERSHHHSPMIGGRCTPIEPSVATPKAQNPQFAQFLEDDDSAVIRSEPDNRPMTADDTSEGGAMRSIHHIAIVGQMGSGKTTVGMLVAARIGWPFCDNDVELEHAADVTAAVMQASAGVDALPHAAEHEIVIELLHSPQHTVIVAPASVVLTPTRRISAISPSWSGCTCHPPCSRNGLRPTTTGRCPSTNGRNSSRGCVRAGRALCRGCGPTHRRRRADPRGGRGRDRPRHRGTPRRPRRKRRLTFPADRAERRIKAYGRADDDRLHGQRPE